MDIIARIERDRKQAAEIQATSTLEERLARAKTLSQNLRPKAAKSELDAIIPATGALISETNKPLYAEAYHLRGDIGRILGEPDNAVKDYAKALELYDSTSEQGKAAIELVKLHCKSIANHTPASKVTRKSAQQLSGEEKCCVIM